MVMRYVMHAQLGHVAYATERQSLLGMGVGTAQAREFGEGTAREIVNAAFEQAVDLLRQRRKILNIKAPSC